MSAALADGVLVLSPSQTRSSAIAAVAALLPSMPPGAVAALVDQHMPGAAEFDLADLEPVEPVKVPPMRMARRANAWRKFRAVVTGHRTKALTVTLAMSIMMLLGVTASLWHPAGDRNHPIGDVPFHAVMDRMDVECHPVGDQTGWCVSGDGRVAAVTITEGGGYTSWLIASNRDWVQLSLGATKGNALMVAADAKENNANPYTKIIVEGRWVIVGRDLTQLEALQAAIVATR